MRTLSLAVALLLSAPAPAQTLIHTFEGSPGLIEESFGTSVAVLGDVDVRSGADGTRIFNLDGDHGDEYFGHALASGDVDGDGTPDLVVGGPGGVGTVRAYSGTCVPPSAYEYCPGAPNSTGAAATIGFVGLPSFAAGGFALTVSGCPPGASAQFLFAFDEVELPFGDGFRCVGGSLLGRFPPLVVGPQGDAAQAVDFAASQIPLAIGSVPKFQCWYRDPAGPGGTGFNASSALSVSVCP